jgi:hypothetical protein
MKYDSFSLILNRYISSKRRREGVEMIMEKGRGKGNPCGS